MRTNIVAGITESRPAIAAPAVAIADKTPRPSDTIASHCAILRADDVQPTESMTSIARKALLTAPIEGSKTVDRIEIMDIELSVSQKAGLHIHPCPVVGHVVEGEIAFQIATGEDLEGMCRVFRTRER